MAFISRDRRSLGGGTSGPPVIANQTAQFGGLTLATYGAYTVAKSGGAVTTVSPSSSGHWNFSVVSGDLVVTPNANGGTVGGLVGGTYALTVNGSVAFNLTVQTTGTDANGFNLANAWSVANNTELATMFSRSGSASVPTGGPLSYGHIIMLRNAGAGGAAINYGAAGQFRTNAPSGTTPTAPTAKAVPAGQLAGHRGSDLSTTNWVTTTRHAEPVTCYVQRITNNANSTANANFFRYTGLTFYWDQSTAQATIGNNGGNTQLSEPYFMFSSGGSNAQSYIAIDNCYFVSDPQEIATGTVYDTYGSIRVTGSYIYIQDNFFENVLTCALHQGNNTSRDGCEIIGNRARRVWSDCFQFPSWGSNQRWNWNLIWDKLSFTLNGNHVDFFQMLDTTVDPPNNSTGDTTGFQFIGNRAYRAKGRVNGYEGQLWTGRGPQKTVSPAVIRNLVSPIFEANFGSAAEFGNAIGISDCTGPTFRGNTVAVHDPGASEYTPINDVAAIRFNNQNCDTWNIQYNVYEKLNLGETNCRFCSGTSGLSMITASPGTDIVAGMNGKLITGLNIPANTYVTGVTPGVSFTISNPLSGNISNTTLVYSMDPTLGTASNNITTTRTGSTGGGVYAYADVFASVQEGQILYNNTTESVFAVNPTAISQVYTLKAGSIGTGYIDYTNRSAALPWYAPVNTVLPAISGTPQVGQTLTASTGTWNGSPTSYDYQWLADGVNIGGATSSTFVLTAAQTSKVITVTVTATNSCGSTAATSAGTSPVTALAGFFAAGSFNSAFRGDTFG